MSFLTKVATTTLGLIVSVGFVGAAFAAPVSQQSLNEHQQLLRTVQDAGITVSINHLRCSELQVDGFYIGRARVLVICQDNGKGDGKLAEWTDNDLDTIRHEVHHLVQDCKNGTIDGDLDNMFSNPDLVEFVQQSGMSQETVHRIIRNYGQKGADNDTILTEIEAFAVARGIGPLTIANAVKQICK